MKNAKYVINCDNCNKMIELKSMTHDYHDHFVDVLVDNMHFDVCKQCAKTFPFIPGVMV